MGGKQKKDIGDHLDWIGEVISYAMNFALVLFWRKTKLVAHNLYKLTVATYKFTVSLFVPLCLASFGIEIVFFTSFSLIWKLPGWLMIAIGLSILYLVLYSIFFRGKQNYEEVIEKLKNKEVESSEDSESNQALENFTIFAVMFVAIIGLIGQPTTWFEKSNIFWNGYNFKFIFLQLIQENILSGGLILFVVVAVVILISFSALYTLYKQTFQQEKN